MSKKDAGASSLNSLDGTVTNAQPHYRRLTPDEVPQRGEGLKIPLMMSTTRFSRKPTGVEAGYLRKEIVANGEQTLTYRDFCTKVVNGHAFVPAILSGTTSKDFLGQQVFCLDFDEMPSVYETDPIAWNEIYDYAVLGGLRVICIYPTYSFTFQNPKCRLVLDNEAIIKSGKERDEIMDCLLKAFARFKPDTSCSDRARVFFGSNYYEELMGWV